MTTPPQKRSAAELLEELRTHQVELEMQNLQLRETQGALDASHQKYLALFDHAPAPYLIFNTAHAIEEINLAGSRLLGEQADHSVLRPFAHYLSDESRPAFHQHLDQVLQLGTPQSAELRLSDGRGGRVKELLVISSRLDGSAHSAPRVLMAVFDLTAERHAQRQRQELEQQLRSAQKMESLGRMAGGMAHDFNNLLHAIAGFADLAAGDTDLLQVRESLAQIRSMTKRASRLTQQILAFSRRQPSQPTAVLLDELLMELSPMLQRLLRSGVTIHIQPSPHLPPAWIDKGQLEQVIINLVLNAVDAIAGEGDIVLRTHALGGPGKGASDAPDSVALEVCDTGTGLSPDVLEHLFDPFFTTKPKGRGTGLGLSVVHGIVSHHGGRVLAENRRDTTGARFTVELPVATVSASVAPPAVEPAAEDGHGECILVVEDEDVLRELCARILTAHGYQVITAFDGQDALEVYRAHQGARIVLIVMDVVMPRLGGVQAYQAIQALGPCPPVLFVSGFVGDADLQPGIQDHNNFLAKPFGEQALLQAVTRSLLQA